MPPREGLSTTFQVPGEHFETHGSWPGPSFPVTDPRPVLRPWPAVDRRHHHPPPRPRSAAVVGRILGRGFRARPDAPGEDVLSHEAANRPAALPAFLASRRPDAGRLE